MCMEAELLLTAQNISTQNDFKFLTRRQTKVYEVSLSSEPSGYVVDRFDAACSCYICKSLGPFKHRYDEKTGL
jgi:hypothetical protein